MASGVVERRGVVMVVPNGFVLDAFFYFFYFILFFLVFNFLLLFFVCLFLS